METLEAIYKRRSIREFTEEPVTEAETEVLLRAAFSAPTAVNAQPWEFIVVDNPEILAQMKKQLIFARYNAPLAIVVLGNLRLAFKGPDRDMWISDCSAAVENVLLAATDQGLASVWIGVYPVPSKMEPVRRILEIPAYVVPLAIVYVGHGAAALEGRCRYNEKRVYRQKYDASRKHRTKDKPKVGHYS